MQTRGSKGHSHQILGKTCHRERKCFRLRNTQLLAEAAQSCHLGQLRVGPDPLKSCLTSLCSLTAAASTVTSDPIPSLCQG